MLQPGRTYSSDDYRYGFNGMEADNELKGTGNSYDFGARIYDPRVAKFISVDPAERNFPGSSPYHFAGNSPIVAIDENGEYSVWKHFQITFYALRNVSIDRKTAEQIAHLASTYADYMSGKDSKSNWFIALFNRRMLEKETILSGDLLKMNEKVYGSYDATKYSQDDERISSVSIHSMRAYWEGISAQEAVNRAVYGGTFLQWVEDGKMLREPKTITIEGAENVINSFRGRDLSKLEMDEKKRLGVALHTIQDAQVHQGGTWVQEHDDLAEKLGNCNQHPNAGCFFNANIEGAIKETEKAIDAILNDKEYKFELHNNKTYEHDMPEEQK